MFTTTPMQIDPNRTVWVVWTYWYNDDRKHYQKEISCICHEEYVARQISKSGCCGDGDNSTHQWWMIGAKECLGFALTNLNAHMDVSDLEIDMVRNSFKK